ncbi:helix-turn-helix domain-containing protein [Phenylobacterium sp.]|uniref:helix-turn-helix domain-containing protein n=1 Tax=Phenylobacterium sp. TaxID=1871053 RepID=UPI002737FF30|nr:helix-turn-helix domain-containing protein [Phenylobacterium sp.]MDP3868333.1 helix-turn-helix domain-containing protein [Phenylobacterium sp.]
MSRKNIVRGDAVISFNNAMKLILEPQAHPSPGVETIGQRLRISTRMFQFFVMLRKKKGLDVAAFQIMSAFNLAGLAEQQRAYGGGTAFGDAPFSAVLSATALSDMTGIPRQTVRRRLQTLQELGYITLQADGSYRLNGHWSELDIVDEIGGLIAR